MRIEAARPLSVRGFQSLPQPRTTYRVYVDESGVRAYGLKTGAHFILTAIILPDVREATARHALAQLRTDFGVPAGHELHFVDLNHSKRLHLAQTIASLPFITISSVISCKAHFGSGFLQDGDKAYLFTLRLLLERVSWCVNKRGGQAYVTFAHIKGFPINKLHNYISHLQAMQTRIEWAALHLPIRMVHPNTIEMLQFADAAASATAQAFEPDRFGNAERRYLEALAPRLYRYVGSPITTYGMKLLPNAAVTHPDYAWVQSL